MKALQTALTCIAIASTAWAQSPPATYSVSGIVVDHATNQPLPNVLIMLALSAHMQQQQQEASKQDGSFSFSSLAPGKYVLSAQRKEQSPQFYMGYEGYLTGIATGPELKSDRIVFPLISGGSITGAVIDQDGDPVSNANVLLYRKEVSLGREEIRQTASKQTRSSGKFAFRDLEPGTYYVAVIARPWYAQNNPHMPDNGDPAIQTERAQFDVAYPITYYGDTDDPNAAAPITVAEASNTEIRISPRAEPAIHVVFPGTRFSGGDSYSANLKVKGLGGLPIELGAPMSPTPEGYELSGLAPGKYSADLTRYAEGKAQESWHENVSVVSGGSADMQRSPLSRVSGHLLVQNVIAAGPMVVMLTGAGGIQYGAQPDAKGNFEIVQSIEPGRYEIGIAANQPGIYVSSLSAQGAKVIGSTIEIGDSAAVTLDIGAAAGTEKVDGIALRKGVPLPGAMILLLPEDKDRPELIRRDQSDSDGTFTLDGTAPGRYRLVAIDDGRGLAYRDPAVIAPYLAAAPEVIVPLPQKQPLKIEVSPRH